MYECIVLRLAPVGGLFEMVGCVESFGYQLLCESVVMAYSA
jgi:hypothetical protein